VRADIKLPQVLSVGVSHQLSPKIRLLGDWSWTGWDAIQDLRVVDAATGATISDTRLGFDNSWRAGVGVEYGMNRSWLLRGGLVYDTTPVQDAYRTPRLPDENRIWLAFGARYQPAADASWWLDIGYAHIFIDDARSNLPFAGASAAEAQRGALRGSYESSVDILAVQVGFRF
jgi:long-chain fatty acid transport protein